MNPRCWAKCLRCEHRAMVRRVEIGRAKGCRCFQCGGPMELSEKARDELTGGKDVRKIVKAQRKAHDRASTAG